MVNDILSIGLERIADLLAEVRVSFDKARRFIASETQHIVADKNLPIAVTPAANSDQRNFELLPDVSGEDWIDHLDDTSEATGSLHRFGISDDLLRLLRVTTITSIAALDLNSLREKTDVPQNRNSRINQVSA